MGDATGVRESLCEPVRVCADCGRPTWLAECCNRPVVTPIVHVHRESAMREGAFHLLCSASMREEWHVGENAAASATCEACLAILAREAVAAA